MKLELNLKQTQNYIKEIKDFFELSLAISLNLTRVSSPMFVTSNSGLNDYLDGSERPVKFMSKSIKGEELEIVQSLAKWKRSALKKYEFQIGEGIYADMNAIRPDEKLDFLHSMYVDQWDWELVISREQRTEQFLREVVCKIFKVFKETENNFISKLGNLQPYLPNKITFITSEQLLQLYPDLSPKDREFEITKKYKAVFISEIGGKLSNGEKHDGRSCDYDDWDLNGDILFWYPLLNVALEVSSMGIRVDSKALQYQLDESDINSKDYSTYHKNVLSNELPCTIGGGIGQSRLCMFFLRKNHIGEVQSSVWDTDTITDCCNKRYKLL